LRRGFWGNAIGKMGEDNVTMLACSIVMNGSMWGGGCVNTTG